MSESPPTPESDPTRPTGLRTALVFGVVAATIEMGVILLLAFC